MLNQFVIVGRIKEIESKENKEITVEVPRSYKNEKGEYDSDLLTIVMGNILNNMKEYCNVGDLVGIKGRIGKNNSLISEKITFLSSSNK